MSAGSTQGIGPVSVRYAAQIRELLYSQAVQKAAAEQEAMRQQDAAEKAARLQPAVDDASAVKLDAVIKPAHFEVGAAPSSLADAASKAAPGDILDIQA